MADGQLRLLLIGYLMPFRPNPGRRERCLLTVDDAAHVHHTGMESAESGEINRELARNSRPIIEDERQIQAKISEFTFERLISGDEFLAVLDRERPRRREVRFPSSHRCYAGCGPSSSLSWTGATEVPNRVRSEPRDDHARCGGCGRLGSTRDR